MSQQLRAEPCVLFALQRESGAFRRLFPRLRQVAHVPCRAWLAWGHYPGKLLIVHTGVGAENMRRALIWALDEPQLGREHFRAGLVVMAGYAGGLAEHLKIGDVLVASDIADTAGNVWPTTWPGSLPPLPWQPNLHFARLLHSPVLVASPEDKRQLAQTHQAQAVDMESGVVASLCTEAKMPFGAIRGISDDVHTSLSPRLLSLLSGSRVSLLRLGKACLRSPGLIKELLRLQRHTSMASTQLARVLDVLLAHYAWEK